MKTLERLKELCVERKENPINLLSCDDTNKCLDCLPALIELVEAHAALDATDTYHGRCFWQEKIKQACAKLESLEV